MPATYTVEAVAIRSLGINLMYEAVLPCAKYEQLFYTLGQWYIAYNEGH
jgi:hypothetical protein